MATEKVELIARVDELARREQLVVGETARARIYRDPVGGTVMWVPHAEPRLELTLIQVRMAAEAQADRLHALLAASTARTVDDIPAHELGLDAAVAVEHWPTLEQDFFPPYLTAHREVQAGQR